MNPEHTKTLFIDIDGTLLKHHGIPNRQSSLEPILLPGVMQKLSEWEEKGYRIILVTARKESERKATIRQLKASYVQYDRLIMGVSRGERIIINDVKPGQEKMGARAINVERNGGLTNIEI
jgi:hydroxymethylpyrimidine pyrophosphatase-like HAD family hydrolase